MDLNARGLVRQLPTNRRIASRLRVNRHPFGYARMNVWESLRQAAASSPTHSASRPCEHRFAQPQTCREGQSTTHSDSFSLPSVSGSATRPVYGCRKKTDPPLTNRRYITDPAYWQRVIGCGKPCRDTNCVTGLDHSATCVNRR